MFLLNSRHPLACVPCIWLPKRKAPFFRSYRSILPSSFSTILSSALVCSTCPPVSVSGTAYNVGALSWKLINRPDTPFKSRQSQNSVTHHRLRIINLISIGYASRPCLRCRLTLRGLTLRRNPWAFGGNVFHVPFRYSCPYSRFRYLQKTSRFSFTDLRNAPLPLACSIGTRKPAISVHDLSPVTFSAQDVLTRPVSYYAFFKGWLLLSQPPGCFGHPTSFTT